MLGEKIGADIFVLLNYVQMIKTNGARTHDFLMSALGCSVSNADNIFMSIGIVEAKSGRILWTNATPKHNHLVALFSLLVINQKLAIFIQ
nr:hypothetical protein [Rickettsia conorii]